MPRIIRGNTLPEVAIIIPQVFYDERGYFFESFSNEWFRKNISDTTFIQDNESFSIKHVARGLHYQLPPYNKLSVKRKKNFENKKKFFIHLDIYY